MSVSEHPNTVQALQALLHNYLSQGQPHLVAFTAHQLASAGCTTPLQQAATALLVHGYPASWHIPSRAPSASQIAWQLLSAQARADPPPPALLAAAQLGMLSSDIHCDACVHPLDGAWEARRVLAPSMPPHACQTLQHMCMQHARALAQPGAQHVPVTDLPAIQAAALYLAARQPWLLRALGAQCQPSLVDVLVQAQRTWLTMLAADAERGCPTAWTLAAADVRHVWHVPDAVQSTALCTVLQALVNAAPRVDHDMACLDALAESVAASDCEAVMRAFDQVRSG